MKRLYIAFIASLIFFIGAAINYTGVLENSESVHDDFQSSVRFAQPSYPSGVGTYSSPSTQGNWAILGWSLMYGGDTTLMGNTDSGYLEETYSSSPKYSTTFSVKTLTGNQRVIQGSIYVLWASGTYEYMNIRIKLNPANFDQNSLYKGRSLIDNLLLETSGTARTNMENSLAKGGTAWFNGVFSGVPAGGTHSKINAGALWKDGQYAYTKPGNTFVSNRIYSRLSYSTFTKNVIDDLLDIPVVLPQIIEVDRTNPTVSFSPNSKSWGNTDVPVQITPSDSGSGVSKWRWRKYDNDPMYATTGTWGAWSSYLSPAARQLTLTGIENKIQVEVVDKAGNTAYVTSGLYQIEKSPPALEMESLTGEDYYDGTTYWVKPYNSVTFTVRQRDSQSRNRYQWARVMDGTSIAARSVHEFSGTTTNSSKQVTSTSISIDSAYRTQNTFQGQVEWTITPKVHGKTYEIQRYFRDFAGNSLEYEPGIKLGVDGQGPTVSANPTSGGWDRLGHSVSLNYSDAESGVVTKQYAWSTSTATPTSWTNYSGTVSQNQEGAWYLHYKATDAAGNVNTGYFGAYQVDTTKAALVSDSLTGADYFDGTTYWVRENKSVTYTVTQTDNLSGNRQQFARLLENGTIVSRARHEFDDSNIYNIDYLNTDSNVVIDGARRTLNTSQGTVEWTITPKTHGKKYEVQRYLYDVAWNPNTYETGALLAVDGLAPTVVADVTSGPWSATGHTVSLTYTDADTNVVSRKYAWSESTATPTTWTDYTGPVTQSQEGIWYLHYTTTDSVGNVNTGYFGTYNVDTSDPDGEFKPYSVGWTNKNTFTTFDPYDSHSGVAQWRYRLSTDNGLSYGAWSEYIIGDENKSIVLTSEAMNKVQVEISDNVGHVQLLTSGSYDIDKTKPSGVFSQYDSGWTNQNISTIFDPSDEGGSGVSYWRYKVSTDDGLTYSSWSGPILGDTNQTIALNSQGLNKIQVEVFDNAGNKEVVTSGTYKIDKTPPTGYFIPNDSPWIPSLTTKFITEDSGGSGINHWAYRISTDNGNTYGSWSNDIYGATPNEITLTSSGENRVQVVVIDNAGHYVTVTSGTYYIDSIKPTAPSIVTSQNSSEKASFAIIDGTDVAYSGFDRTEYKLSGANTSDWVTYKGEVTIEEEGITTIEARTIDVAGNKSDVVKEQLTLSSTSNTKEISIFPSGSEEWMNRELDVTVSYFDTSSSNGITAKTYELTTSSEFPGVLTQTLPDNGVVNIADNGITYIHVRYEFEDGSSLVKTEGPYKIDEAAIEEFTMTLKDGVGNAVTTWTNQDLFLEMALTSQGQSTTELQYKIDGQLTWTTYESGVVIDNEGETRIIGRAVNEAGTVSEQQHVAAKIDKTIPSFEKIDLHETTNKDGVTTYNVSVTAKPDVSGISRIELVEGSALVRNANDDTYTLKYLSTKPTILRAYDVAGNVAEESFFELATVDFANGYDINQESTDENVIATIGGSGQLSYQLGNETLSCGVSPCEVTIDKNTEFSAINESGIKQSKKTLFIDNIDKSPTRLIFSGERQSLSDIFFNWNIDIANSSITCEYVRGIETITPGSGTSYLFTGAENYNYKCVLTGTLDGNYVSSNEITIEPDYGIEAPSEANSSIAKILIPNNIVVEQSRIGTFYYINFRTQNYEEPIPLPGELF